MFSRRRSEGKSLQSGRETLGPRLPNKNDGTLQRDHHNKTPLYRANNPEDAKPQQSTTHAHRYQCLANTLLILSVLTQIMCPDFQPAPMK